jgi:DNA-binding PadR family transcriptional regulator
MRTRPGTDPTLLVLSSLASGPKHGYALIKDIETFAGVVLGPGTLYGCLTRLETRGLVEPVGDPDRRRPYRLTAAGAVVLRERLEEAQRVVETGRARLDGATS